MAKNQLPGTFCIVSFIGTTIFFVVIGAAITALTVFVLVQDNS
jgi:hypothetical protein